MRFNPLLCCLAFVLLGYGCASDAPEADKGPANAVPQPTQVTIVTGWVDLSGLPELDESVVEVFLVPKLQDGVAQTIRTQNELLLARLRPPEEDQADKEDEADDGELALLGERDRNALEQQLEALLERVPKPFESTFTVNDRSHSFTSDRTLYQWYSEALGQVRLTNLVDKLNRVGEQMQADYEALNALAQSGDSSAALQARANVNWLAVLSDLMGDYSTLVRRFDDLRRRALMMQRREAMRQRSPQAATPQDPWLAFHQGEGERMQLAFYRDSVDTGYAAADGSFELKGEGTVIAGLDVDGNTVFFVEGLDEEAPVRLREISRRTVLNRNIGETRK